MNAKTFKFLTAGIVSGMAVVAVVCATANSGIGNLFRSSQADESKNFTITASQIISAIDAEQDTFQAGGLTWQFGGKYKKADGNVLFGDGWLKNTTASGATSNNGQRGGGLLSFDITKVSANAGIDVYARDYENADLGRIPLGAGISGDGQSSKTFSYDDEVSYVQFTFGGNAAEDVGTAFSQIQFTYKCVADGPTMKIDVEHTTVSTGAELSISNKIRRAAGLTYGYVVADVSGTDVLSVSLDGHTVTANAAGTATVKGVLKDGENVMAQSNVVTITVTAAQAEDVDMLVCDTTYWQGAGLFFDVNPTSAGTTYSNLSSISKNDITVTTTNASLGTSSKVGFQTLMTDTAARYYITWQAAPGAGEYTVTMKFFDSVANKNYIAVASFNGGTYIPYVSISGDETVDLNETIELTATLNVNDVVSSYAWTTSDSSKVSIVSGANAATVTVRGDAVGVSDIAVTITTASSKVYTSKVTIEAVNPSAMNYMQWSKASGGPLYIQGAGMIIAVDYTSIGYENNNDANSVKDKVTVTVTGKANPNIVEFQKPGFAGDNGLYVTFADAAYDSITAITVKMPHKTTGVLHTATMEVTFSAGVPTYVTLNGVPYADYMNPQA